MKATKLRAVEMVRRLRDRHARQLAGKSDAEIIAFAAMISGFVLFIVSFIRMMAIGFQKLARKQHEPEPLLVNA